MASVNVNNFSKKNRPPPKREGGKERSIKNEKNVGGEKKMRKKN